MRATQREEREFAKKGKRALSTVKWKESKKEREREKQSTQNNNTIPKQNKKA